MLVGWLVSWFVLGNLWRHQQIRARTMFFWLLAFVVAATVMNWHPIFPYLPLMPNGSKCDRNSPTQLLPGGWDLMGPGQIGLIGQDEYDAMIGGKVLEAFTSPGA